VTDHDDELHHMRRRSDIPAALYRIERDVRSIRSAVNYLLQRVQLVIDKENTMSAELDALKAQVAETIGVEQSAVTLLNGVNAKLTDLANQLAAAGIDNAAVLALSADLKSNTDALAAAVAANPAP